MESSWLFDHSVLSAEGTIGLCDANMFKLLQRGSRVESGEKRALDIRLYTRMYHESGNNCVDDERAW